MGLPDGDAIAVEADAGGDGVGDTATTGDPAALGVGTAVPAHPAARNTAATTSIAGRKTFNDTWTPSASEVGPASLRAKWGIPGMSGTLTDPTEHQVRT